MTVLRLWWEMTKLVLTGAARWPVGVYLTNNHLAYDAKLDVVNNAANWYVTTLNWVGGEDRYVTLDAEPDKAPVYRQAAGA
jgi:hypothetical protein